MFVTASGFDPSLFHDADGRHYFLNMLYDWRCDQPHFAGTVIQEFDTRRLCLTGERRHFYRGNRLGVCEGPQILQKDGYYYLLCAAGGTGYQHAATVARSASLLGEYAESPYFPLLTSADDAALPLQKCGHACFVPFAGEWYIVHLCARPLTQRGACVLGRETAIQKIVWENGWPRLANGTAHAELCVQVPAAAPQPHAVRAHITFKEGKLPPSLKTLHRPLAPEKESIITR